MKYLIIFIAIFKIILKYYSIGVIESDETVSGITDVDESATVSYLKSL